MPSNDIARFRPSRYGFRFPNRWPSNPARTVRAGFVAIPIGDTGRGLCGGMAFAARDRFERNEEAPLEDQPPAPGTALFREIVERQFASFGSFFSVPIRFWLASVGSQAARTRETVQKAWPAIKAGIDDGHPPMVGLVRRAGWNPLALGLGHQVVAYRYEETSTGITIWIYDPNHPGGDDVTVAIERRPDGTYEMRQSGEQADEPLVGLLALPFDARR